DSFHRWWDDLSDVRLDADVVDQLVDGVTHQASPEGATHDSVAVHATESQQRDELIVAMLRATRGLRGSDSD
ncbi:MAG: hypothetical protein KTR32_24095, partial [Granulosicoccus sp.]|nr:hypothetical protein [Granulosicoccus sp.]